ncbi:MAG: hypothetical protein K8T10_10305 [Candidatus Eremiobacteraeota bacterium]|nr:hypothetical protein [Candidatus Eremiobacteraeota bacterium]
MKKNNLIFLVLLIAVSFFLFSHPAYAKKSGLLLGLRSDTPNPKVEGHRGYVPPQVHRYRTIWIYPRGNTLGINMGNRIIVPRDTGFWEVGVRRMKKKTTLKVGKKTVNKTWIEDIPYAVPLGKRPHPKFKNYTEHTNGLVDLSLLFVGNNYLCVDGCTAGYSQGAAHTFAGSFLRMHPLDNLKKSVKITQIYSKNANKVLMKCADDYFKKHPDTRERLFEKGILDAWGLIRQSGHWVTRGFLNYKSEVVRGHFAHYDITLKPPAKLVSYDKLAPSWSVIKRNMPGALDAFSSPEGDILGVMTDKILYLYLHKGNNVNFRKPTLEIDLRKNECAIMIQWATGDFVNKWTQIIKKIL